MPKQTTISISEARSKIFQIAEEVQAPGHYFTLTDKGKPKAVILSAEEFDSWQETLEVMRDFPDLDEDIAQVKKDIKSGNYKVYTSLEDLLAKDGFILAEKVTKGHAVHRKAKSKSRKTSGKNSR